MNSVPERVIRRRRSLQLVDGRLLHYGDLLLILIRRDFVARYQQTILGPAWFVLQPLITTGAFTLIFSGGLQVSTDGIRPAFLFYLCGMLPWLPVETCFRRMRPCSRRSIFRGSSCRSRS